jgi:hypothetical protein
MEKIDNAVLRREGKGDESPSRHCVLQESLRFAGGVPWLQPARNAGTSGY